MLKFMRKHANSWLVGLIIGAIIVVFVLWGIGTFRSAQFQVVAKVNGTNIYLPEYLRAYQKLLRTYQERLGSDFNEETAKALNIQGQTLNQLIDELLIRQAGERLGLTVTDAELRQYIQKNPLFADERGFSEKRYYQILARQRLPASDYEAYERQRLLLQKVIGFITSFAKVTEADLEETYRLENEAVRVDFLVVAPTPFLPQQQATPAEVEGLYKSQGERFREPEKFRADILFLPYADFAKNLKPDPQKLESFFYDHLEQFAQPQAVRVEEATLALPANTTAAERQRLQQLAEAIVQGARRGVPLEQLLRRTPLPQGVRPQVQDLGVVARGQKPPAWEAVVFSLKKGEAGLVATPTGLQLVQVVDIVETKAPALAAVQPQVEKAWRQAEARQLAQQQAAVLRQQLATASLADVATQQNLNYHQTPWLSAKEPLPGLGLQPALSQAALALKPREISKPLALQDGIALVQVRERRESQIPPLEQIKDRVAAALRLDKAKAAAAQEAKTLLTRLQKGEPLAKVASQAGLTVRDSGWFTRPQGFPAYPQNQELVTTAFTLSAQQPLPAEPSRVNDDHLILVYKDRRQPSAEQFAQDKEEIHKNLLEIKRQMVFSQWLAEERQRAKMKIYDLPS
ncbi:MAG: SurA N-terminal domain-containing protein [Desulfobacca sp.]|uniref:SurA N-terminal domain-containing protein n=1 Tax=Desulfobacca sp. TaxID=2067990 RepID=UPI00404B7FE8